VSLSPLSWAFLVVMSIVFPMEVIRTAKRMRAADGSAAISSRQRVYIAGIINQLFILALAWLTAREQGLHFLGRAAIGWREIGAGVLALGVLAGLARLSEAARSPEERRKMWVLGLVPRTAREWMVYAPLITVASVGEELAFRGVLFSLFAILTGSSLLAAVLSAAVFGVAHFPQGWKSMSLVLVIGLVKQALVAVTATLWVAVGVHFVYDIVAPIRTARRAIEWERVPLPG
jgi:membrane protease YdiL (CAAX protease family)